MPRRARALPCALSALALGLVLALPTSSAEAKPQLTAGLTTGGALTDLRTNGPRLAYHLGGRFEALFLRDRPSDMAIGPYLDVATHAFDTFESGGGLSWLVPTGDTAFVFSGGAFGRLAGFGFEPGAEGTIFWGSRSFNYHSSYTLGLGLFLQGRYGFGDGKQADAVLGVQIDLEYVLFPFLLAYEALAR